MLSKLGLLLTAGCLMAAASTNAWADSPSLHGFADISVKTDYITPRGLHVVADGTTIQYLNGLVLSFDRAPTDTITNFALVGGIWSDFNPGYSKAHNSEAFNEFDWFLGANAKFGTKVTAGVQYVEFISPQNAFETEKNIEFSLSYSDGLKPISINPYVKVFYAMEGDSTVVLGKKGETYDVEIGATPSIDVAPGGFALTLSAPTWVTVGPEEYWGGNDGNVGVFSTGIKASHPIGWLPSSAGHWSAYASYQYYNFINDNLVKSRTILTGETGDDDGIFAVGLSLGF
jgi:hypothetical protein